MIQVIFAILTLIACSFSDIQCSQSPHRKRKKTFSFPFKPNCPEAIGMRVKPLQDPVYAELTPTQLETKKRQSEHFATFLSSKNDLYAQIMDIYNEVTIKTRKPELIPFALQDEIDRRKYKLALQTMPLEQLKARHNLMIAIMAYEMIAMYQYEQDIQKKMRTEVAPSLGSMLTELEKKIIKP